MGAYLTDMSTITVLPLPPRPEVAVPADLPTATGSHALAAARELADKDRVAGMAALNHLFRQGVAPSPALSGRYRGSLLALDIAPGFTRLTQAITARWLPWQGKTFDAERQSGDNIFTRDSLRLAHIYWPGYGAYQDDGPATYRAFRFRTYIAAGLADPDRQVLKIDYSLPENPGATIRHVLDELVQVDDATYLGKAHMRWWWGKWQLVAFFALQA